MIYLKNNFRNDVIMFLLLGVSAIPYIDSNKILTTLIAIFLGILFFFSKNQKIDNELFYICIAILICVFFQSVIFSYFKLITILGLILKVLTAFFAIKLLNEKFIDYYLRLMVFFSIVSLVIFIPIFIHPSLLDTIINATPSFLSYQYELWGFQVDNKTLIIYNLMEETGLLRNNGPFWEPGAFGGFLIIALMFNTVRKSTLLNKTNWLFFVTIISTQSTTAYLAVFAFIFCYLLFQNYSMGVKSLLIILGVAGLIAFQKIPFLGAKIKDENENAQNAIETKGGDTRIASAILDWDDIKRYPLTGRGIWPETRVDKKFEYVIRNNGFTNFLAEWGIFLCIIYFFYYYKGFKIFCMEHKSNKFMPFIILGIIWVVSFSENYFGLPFFWALVFLDIPFGNKYHKKNLNYPLTQSS
ncbi:MAG: hypothetical protein M3Z26_08790 [Bacteroidota bacterium]|nr:hypothetical protein [Bacteroidota bacterium]